MPLHPERDLGPYGQLDLLLIHMDLGELDIELLLYLQMQGWCRCRIWPDIDLYPRLGLDPQLP